MSRASGLRYVETGKTVFENLRPTTSHALAFTGHRPSVLARTRIKTFQEFRELFQVFFSSQAEGGFDADPRDTSYFTVKLFQYLTSSPERRKDYENMSWWDYIEGESYGESFRKLLQKWPQALVAMNAQSADARTNGSTTVQIMLDMVRDSGYRDGILAGPTNEAWLEHWRRYLEAQGVEFIQGRIDGFAKRTLEGSTDEVVWPKVSCFEPRHPLNDHGEPELLGGYFLLALPAYEVARIAKEYDATIGATPDLDLARAARIDTSRFFDALGDPAPMVPEEKTEFRHYAGIQFYFEQDVLWLDGQVYHPNSFWGLTTVSQARFWDEKMDWEHGYRGVLSVIIADWDTPSARAGGKRARECTPQELAEEVWAQIKDGRKARGHWSRAIAAASSPILQSPSTGIWTTTSSMTARLTATPPLSTFSHPESGRACRVSSMRAATASSMASRFAACTPRPTPAFRAWRRRMNRRATPSTPSCDTASTAAPTRLATSGTRRIGKSTILPGSRSGTLGSRLGTSLIS